jgi:hypothetical protein
VLLGSPPTRLLIFTGIAMPGLQSNGQLDGQEVTVDLNVRSNTINPPFTATVGLASIYNTESDMLFATDDVKVVTGENLELLLVCNIAAMGDTSILHRFSYQATVLLHADNGSIAGNIRWPPHFMTFLANEPDLFQITPFTMEAGPGVPGSSFGTITPRVVNAGATVGTVALKGGQMVLPYEIHDLPLGVALYISVDAKPGAFLVLNTTASFNFVQVSGPKPITLSAAHLIEHADFEAQQHVPPQH